MACRILRATFFALACCLVDVGGQHVTSRTFPHNTPVSGALPRNFKLDSKLKSTLNIDAPADFEAVLLGNNSRYKFNDREYLLKALLHQSYRANVSKTMVDSYEPLDQIGTMVLDYMFTRHFLLNMNPVKGDQLSKMKDAMVRGPTLAFIALKNNFERFIKVDPKLLDTQGMEAFRAAVGNNDAFQDIVRVLPDATKRPAPASFIPKMFKAVIGAVYVDSFYSMETTEAAILPLFKKELDLVFNKVTVRNQPVA